MKEIVELFGKSLDRDEFEVTQTTLSPNCKYLIGKETLIGPEAICKSYEQNMIEGRKKLDELIWGKSRIEVINDAEYFVHFTDFLTHKGIKFTHKCKQLVKVKKDKIVQIKHIENSEAQEKLDEFYRKVELKK